MSEPRDVKPFVGQLTVPYFMDRKMIAQTMVERQVEVGAAIAFLKRKWDKEKGRGN